jgi:hypothetical protein
VIYASTYVYDRIIQMTNSNHRVIKVELSIDQSNIDLIRDRLRLSRLVGQ